MTDLDLDHMATVALAILRNNIDEDDRAALKSLSDCHDVMDANLALYGAFCSVYFQEPDFDKEADLDKLNALSDHLDTIIRDNGL